MLVRRQNTAYGKLSKSVQLFRSFRRRTQHRLTAALPTPAQYGIWSLCLIFLYRIVVVVIHHLIEEKKKKKTEAKHTSTKTFV